MLRLKCAYLGLLASLFELEDGKGAQVVRVVTVGDAIDGVVGPVQGASFDGRLESGKHFQIRRLSVAASVAPGCSVDGGAVSRTLVGLKYKNINITRPISSLKSLF